MNKRDRQSLIIYGANFVGSFIPEIGGLFNPIGSVIFGGIDVAKRFYNQVDNHYVRTIETLGALGYSFSAVSNILSSLGGDAQSLGRGVLDASMAYQLWVNEGVLDNIRGGQIKKDLEKINGDLESVIRKHFKREEK